MNKTLIAGILLGTSISFFSCNKGDDPVPEPSPTGTGGGSGGQSGGSIGPVPATFSKKVLLETFVGTWCSTCPDADDKRDQVASASNRVIAVSVHQSDPMTISLFGSLYNIFGGNSPSGMVSRTPSLGNVILSPSQWMSNTSVALGGTATGGLAIKSTVSGSTANIEVHAGFNTALSGDYRLTVYLVEDSVTGTSSGYQQMNAYNNSSGSPYYNMGNPIPGYKHNRVVRSVLTADTGDPIPASKLVAGGDHTMTFNNVSLSGYNMAYLYVVAFVNKVGATATSHAVLNAQSAPVGTTRDWD